MGSCVSLKFVVSWFADLLVRCACVEYIVCDEGIPIAFVYSLALLFFRQRGFVLHLETLVVSFAFIRQRAFAIDALGIRE